MNLTIELEEKITELDQVVVTGTMRETYIEESPVKVNVVSNQFLNKNPSNNLMESVSFINGLYNEVSCAAYYSVQDWILIEWSNPAVSR